MSVTNLADARRRAAARGVSIASVNPASGVTRRTFEPLADAEIESRLERAAAAFGRQRRTTFAERSRAMMRVADILDEEREALGRLITSEMGKPISAAIEEIAKCARACRYYAEHTEALLADEAVEVSGARTFVRYQALGLFPSGRCSGSRRRR